MNLSNYNKLLPAIATALTVTASAVADKHVTPNEWWMIAVAWAAVFGVYQLPNLPKAPPQPPTVVTPTVPPQITPPTSLE